MNLQSTIGWMGAAANPFPLKASFRELEGGMMACKMCGAKVKHQGDAADHLLKHHREMEGYGTSEGVKKAWDSRGRGDKVEAIAKAHGFKRGKGAGGGDSVRVYEHPSKGKLSIWQDGYWRHRIGGKVQDEGRGAKHLVQTFGMLGVKKLEARDFSQARRKKLAKSGDAMPGGGFPIVNREDLANAKRAIGRAKNPAAARRHINERARALGAKPIGAQSELRAGGPGSGRHPEGGRMDTETLANRHKPHKGMCDLSNPICRAYTDMRIKNPNWTPSGARGSYREQDKPEKLTAQSEFSPSMRLRMPKKAGTGQVTENPQYTGGQPPLQAGKKMKAFGMNTHMRKGGAGCSTHGFHRGHGYEGKAHTMGHRMPLSAAAEKRRRKAGDAKRGCGCIA